jgi:hypothetical protein
MIDSTSKGKKKQSKREEKIRQNQKKKKEKERKKKQGCLSRDLIHSLRCTPTSSHSPKAESIVSKQHAQIRHYRVSTYATPGA